MEIKKNPDRLSVVLKPKTKRALKECADQENRTLSNYVRIHLEKLVEQGNGQRAAAPRPSA